jgi:hypothetical protein
MYLATKYQHKNAVIASLILLIVLTACGQKKEVKDNEQNRDSNTAQPVAEVPPKKEVKQVLELEPPITVISSPSSIPSETSKLKHQAGEESEFGDSRNYVPKFPKSQGDKETTYPAADNEDAIEYYSVVVSGSKNLQLPGNKGLLNVWIGDEKFQPIQDETMNSADSNIVAAGEYALVEANAPDFEISPITSKCLLLHPSGVDVKFFLSAQQVGSFVVSATVNLFNTPDCSGPAIPKTANTLEVNVLVNDALIKEQRRQSFIDIFWAKAIEFWGALLALLFGLILFLVRKKLKKLFGYDKNEA